MEEEGGQEDEDNYNECKKEHFWDSILEARDILKDNKKNYWKNISPLQKSNF